MSKENKFSTGLSNATSLNIAPQRYTGISISATDDKQLPLLLAEAVEGIPKAMNGCEAARRKGSEVTEVSLLIGEWAKDKAYHMTFEELVSELRKHIA